MDACAESADATIDVEEDGCRLWPQTGSYFFMKKRCTSGPRLSPAKAVTLYASYCHQCFRNTKSVDGHMLYWRKVFVLEGYCFFKSAVLVKLNPNLNLTKGNSYISRG